MNALADFVVRPLISHSVCSQFGAIAEIVVVLLMDRGPSTIHNLVKIVSGLVESPASLASSGYEGFHGLISSQFVGAGTCVHPARPTAQSVRYSVSSAVSALKRHGYVTVYHEEGAEMEKHKLYAVDRCAAFTSYILPSLLLDIGDSRLRTMMARIAVCGRYMSNPKTAAGSAEPGATESSRMGESLRAGDSSRLGAQKGFGRQRPVAQRGADRVSEGSMVDEAEVLARLVDSGLVVKEYMDKSGEVVSHGFLDDAVSSSALPASYMISHSMVLAYVVATRCMLPLLVERLSARGSEQVKLWMTQELTRTQQLTRTDLIDRNPILKLFMHVVASSIPTTSSQGLSGDSSLNSAPWLRNLNMGNWVYSNFPGIDSSTADDLILALQALIRPKKNGGVVLSRTVLDKFGSSVLLGHMTSLEPSIPGIRRVAACLLANLRKMSRSNFDSDDVDMLGNDEAISSGTHGSSSGTHGSSLSFSRGLDAPSIATNCAINRDQAMKALHYLVYVLQYVDSIYTPYNSAATDKSGSASGSASNGSDQTGMSSSNSSSERTTFVLDMQKVLGSATGHLLDSLMTLVQAKQDLDRALVEKVHDEESSNDSSLQGKQLGDACRARALAIAPLLASAAFLVNYRFNRD